MPGKLILPTPQITTGDWTTVNDSTAQNTPGSLYYTYDSAGRPQVLQYVKFYDASPATLTAGTFVFYTDATHTIVSNVIASAVTYVVSTNSGTYSAAGVMANASLTNGYYIWILKKGYLSNLESPGSVVLGDQLVISNSATGAGTANTWVRVAAGTAPTPTGWHQTLYAIALSSVSSSMCNAWVYGQII